uniref:Uncharacterized protein n=1 Tax=Steinernema glaseri TaxID=37863 RepID=A0A1I7YQU5_9BILA
MTESSWTIAASPRHCRRNAGNHYTFSCTKQSIFEKKRVYLRLRLFRPIAFNVQTIVLVVKGRVAVGERRRRDLYFRRHLRSIVYKATPSTAEFIIRSGYFTIDTFSLPSRPNHESRLLKSLVSDGNQNYDSYQEGAPKSPAKPHEKFLALTNYFFTSYSCKTFNPWEPLYIHGYWGIIEKVPNVWEEPKPESKKPVG